MIGQAKYFAAGSSTARGGAVTANLCREARVAPISFAAARNCAIRDAVMSGFLSNCASNLINTRAIALSACDNHGRGLTKLLQSFCSRFFNRTGGTTPLSWLASTCTSGGIGRLPALPPTMRKNEGLGFRPRTAMHTPLVVFPALYCVTAGISIRGVTHERPSRSTPPKSPDFCSPLPSQDHPKPNGDGDG